MSTCATCRFSKVVYEHQATIAQCRRHAPVMEPAFGHAAWPKVGLEFWCGDFEIKPELLKECRHEFVNPDSICMDCGKLIEPIGSAGWRVKQ